MYQGVHRGIVQVAVEAHDGQLLDRGLWEGIPEPALEKQNLFIEQAIEAEVVLHFFAVDSEVFVPRVFVPRVSRVRLGQTLERVRDENLAALDATGGKN